MKSAWAWITTAFEFPSILLLLPVALLIVSLLFFRKRENSSYHFVLYAMRVLTIILAILALAGPEAAESEPAVHTVYLLDISDSVNGAGEVFPEVYARLSQDITNAGSSLVTFASKPVIEYEQLPRGSQVVLRAEVDSSSTNIEQALYSAVSLIPRDSNGRIVLISDGFENSGDALNAASVFKTLSIPVSSVYLHDGEHDAAIQMVKAPHTVALGASHRLDVHIASTYAFSGRLHFYRDQEYLGEAEVEVTAGMNYFHFMYQAEEVGTHIYEVYLHGNRDFRPENDFGRVAVHVPGKTDIMYVSDAPRESLPVVQALELQGFEVDVTGSSGIPSTLEELLQWRSIIFHAVPASRISYRTMQNLELYVKRLGGGFLMIGGEDSFGPGGYYGTPIERLLPVDMDISSLLKTPALTLVILVDKSGSMGNPTQDYREKIDILKQSVLSAVEMLNPYYSVGILSFDADAEWTVPVTRAGNTETILKDLKKLSPGGGTRMYPAMREAFRALKEDDAKVRHLLIITDGLVDKADFEELSEEISLEGITVSTVAVGADADTELLSRISEISSGRFYHAATIEEAPRIFASESMMISRTLIFEESFMPRISSIHPVVRDIDTLPIFRGCVLSYTKDEALQVITGPENYPLLSLMNYGIGRSAAFTSDLESRWSDLFISSPPFTLFMGQLMRWTTASSVYTPLYLVVEDEKDTIQINADVRDSSGDIVTNETFFASAIASDGHERTVKLSEYRPGMYAGSVLIPADINTLLSVYSSDGTYRGSRTVSRAYSPEYIFSHDRHSGLQLLEDIAERSGGTVVPFHELGSATADTLFPEMPPPRASASGTWNYFLLAALLLFLFDCMLKIVHGYMSNRHAAPEPYEQDVIRDIGLRKKNAEQHDLSFWFGSEYGRKSE